MYVNKSRGKVKKCVAISSLTVGLIKFKLVATTNGVRAAYPLKLSSVPSFQRSKTSQAATRAIIGDYERISDGQRQDLSL